MKIQNYRYLLAFLFCSLFLTNCVKKSPGFQDTYQVETYVYKNQNNSFRLESVDKDYLYINKIRDKKQSIYTIINGGEIIQKTFIQNVFIIQNDTNHISYVYNNTSGFEEIIKLIYKKKYSLPLPCIINKIEKYELTKSDRSRNYILYNEVYGILGFKLDNIYLFKKTDVKEKDFLELSKYILEVLGNDKNTSTLTN